MKKLIMFAAMLAAVGMVAGCFTFGDGVHGEQKETK
jgi:hypothetical protein